MTSNGTEFVHNAETREMERDGTGRGVFSKRCKNMKKREGRDLEGILRITWDHAYQTEIPHPREVTKATCIGGWKSGPPAECPVRCKWL